MLKAVTLIRADGNEITLELSNPEGTGVVVKSIDGLGPPPATVEMRSLEVGSVYQTTRVGARNMTFTLEYIGISVEETRHILYPYLMPRTPLRIRFETGTRKMEIVGYVEKHEVSVFNQRSSSVFNVLCPSPYFEGVTTQDGVTIAGDYDGGFEFPFVNRVDSSPELMFDTETVRGTKSLFYPGEVASGFVLTATAVQDTHSMAITNQTTGDTLVLDHNRMRNTLPGGIVAGDAVIVDTRPGHRRTLLIRGSLEHDIISSVRFESTWPVVIPGANDLSLTNNGSASDAFRWTLNAPVLYQGL